MKKKILCVDDIETNLFILKALFESHYENEYEIVLAKSGIEALDILLKQHIDIILLDIMMPELDGYETAKLILKNKRTKDIPIIFLTAKKDQDTVSKCYESGGVDYLSKPYNEEELFVRIRFHLDLIESKRVLELERKFTQDILDMQDNLVVVTDTTKVLRTNKAVCDFYNVSSMEEFKNKYRCICTTFEIKDGYFHLDLVPKGKNWVDVLVEMLKNKDVLVLIRDPQTSEFNSFDIKAKKFADDYLITLTNITSFDVESKNNEREASYDGLTNVYNRTKLNELLLQQIQNAQDAHTTFSLIMIDIDFFKHINDTYGHLTGDDVLIQISELITSHIRQSDVFARWGGEEFILLLPSVSLENAELIANNLKEKITTKIFPKIGHLTCSFGVTEFKENDTIDDIIQRADAALYQAKKKGRDQVCTTY